jgi:hypothetical protein
MKTQRFAIGILVLNVFLLLCTLFRATSAPPPEVPQVLRAKSLEIVDDQGQVRAMIKVFPADPKVKMPDGTTGYPETVLFRLITSKGSPNVKISASEDGGGISLGGDTNPTYLQLLARGSNPHVKIVNKDGREKTFKAD